MAKENRLVDHPLYKCWSDMNQRCYNPNSKVWKYYGGRGIKVCERWRRKKRRDEESFYAFVNDMGERPEGLTLERKDSNLDYCPENCVWDTHGQQMRTRRPFKRPNQTDQNNPKCSTTWEKDEEIKKILREQTYYHGMVSYLAKEFNVDRCVIYRLKKSIEGHPI